VRRVEALSEPAVDELYRALLAQLAPRWREPLAAGVVRAVRHAGATYAYVRPGEAAPVEENGDPSAEIADAVRVVRLGDGATELQLAVGLWLAELRRATAQPQAPDVVTIPTSREELANAMESAFRARAAAVRALCEQTVPALAERVQRRLGQHGFHAVILPAQTHTLPIGEGSEFTEHPCIYSHNAEDIDVRLADTAEGTHVKDSASRASAEHWLRESPAQAASRDVRRVLGELLPGMGA
jgi:hypothetical protein